MLEETHTKKKKVELYLKALQCGDYLYWEEIQTLES